MSHLGRGVGGNDGPPGRKGTERTYAAQGAEDLAERESVCHPQRLQVWVGGVTLPRAVSPWASSECRLLGWGTGGGGDLLHILGPGRRVAHGHEHAVGQDRDHDEHAEQRWGGGSRKGREQVGREVLPGQSTPFGLSPNPSPAFSQPGARPTLAGYEWMSTLMALRLTTLKGLST